MSHNMVGEQIVILLKWATNLWPYFLRGLKWNLQKVSPFAELAIGTAIQASRGRLRTVADGCERLRTDGCERLRTVAQRRANTPSTPRPPEWNGNLCYAFGKKLLGEPIATSQSTFFGHGMDSMEQYLYCLLAILSGNQTWLGWKISRWYVLCSHIFH